MYVARSGRGAGRGRAMLRILPTANAAGRPEGGHGQPTEEQEMLGESH